jgi:hypothetical protein
VLACGERSLGKGEVKVVRRADVNDVDGPVADQLVGRVEGPRGAELGGRGLRGLG